jgi:peptidoglycan/xylan/chitin deacetylase (PgdA/CDA1 family)
MNTWMREEGLHRRTWLIAGALMAALVTASLASVGSSSSSKPELKPNPFGDLYNPETQTLKRGRRDRNLVALTIDDGPYRRSLPKILAVLRKHHVKATFFMVGKRIAEHPELVREVLAEGHEVGNHSEEHVRLNTMTADRVREDLTQCERHFQVATGGEHMRLFRAPGLRTNPTVQRVVKELGYLTVLANYGGKDFRLGETGPTVTDEEDIVENVLDNVTPGGIILLHDVPETADGLDRILRGLEIRGLEVVTVTELMRDMGVESKARE